MKSFMPRRKDKTENNRWR